MKRVKHKKHIVRHISRHSLHRKNNFIARNKILLAIILAALIVIGASLFIIIKKPFSKNTSDFAVWLCNTADSSQNSAEACAKMDTLKIITKEQCCDQFKKCCTKS